MVTASDFFMLVACDIDQALDGLLYLNPSKNEGLSLKGKSYLSRSTSPALRTTQLEECNVAIRKVSRARVQIKERDYPLFERATPFLSPVRFTRSRR